MGLDLVMVVGYGLVWGLHRWRTSQERPALARLAGWLDGSFDTGTHRASGTYLGVQIVHDLRAKAWTTIACPLPRVPIALHVAPRVPSDEAWRMGGEGEIHELALGDPAFEERYRVEGAPAEVVRRALGPELRAYCVAHYPVELLAVDDALWLAQRERIEQHGPAEAAWGALLAIRRGIEQADTELDEAQLRLAGSPYRPELDDAHVAAARAARAAEVEVLARELARRGLQALRPRWLLAPRPRWRVTFEERRP